MKTLDDNFLRHCGDITSVNTLSPCFSEITKKLPRRTLMIVMMMTVSNQRAAPTMMTTTFASEEGKFFQVRDLFSAIGCHPILDYAGLNEPKKKKAFFILRRFHRH